METLEEILAQYAKAYQKFWSCASELYRQEANKEMAELIRKIRNKEYI